MYFPFFFQIELQPSIIKDKTRQGRITSIGYDYTSSQPRRGSLGKRKAGNMEDWSIPTLTNQRCTTIRIETCGGKGDSFVLIGISCLPSG
jgi:hypothetical protein